MFEAFVRNWKIELFPENVSKHRSPWTAPPRIQKLNLVIEYSGGFRSVGAAVKRSTECKEEKNLFSWVGEVNLPLIVSDKTWRLVSWCHSRTWRIVTRLSAGGRLSEDQMNKEPGSMDQESEGKLRNENIGCAVLWRNQQTKQTELILRHNKEDWREKVSEQDEFLVGLRPKLNLYCYWLL